MRTRSHSLGVLIIAFMALAVSIGCNDGTTGDTASGQGGGASDTGGAGSQPAGGDGGIANGGSGDQGGSAGSGGAGGSGGSGGSGGGGGSGGSGGSGGTAGSGGAGGNGGAGGAGVVTMSFFVTSRALGCPVPCVQCGYNFDNNNVDENDGTDCSSGSGNLGGLAGADAHCQTLASEAGAGGRVWRAYLSITPEQGTAAVNARDRIGTGPWFNAVGVLIATDVNNLHALDPNGDFGLALNNIDDTTALTEQGNMLAGLVSVPSGGDHDILTGTQSDGTAFPFGSNRTCDNWTSSSNAFRARVGHHDLLGLTNANNDGKSWNSAHSPQCSAAGLDQTAGAGYLYCFAN